MALLHFFSLFCTLAYFGALFHTFLYYVASFLHSGALYCTFVSKVQNLIFEPLNTINQLFITIKACLDGLCIIIELLMKRT